MPRSEKHLSQAPLVSSEPRLFATEPKQISLIDVLGEPSSVLWLCGCNLKCPFCHNWKIADGIHPSCRYRKLSDIMDALEPAIKSRLVTYIHVSGGEPLLQVHSLVSLLKQVEPYVKISVDTNLTLPENLIYLLENVNVSHIATDIKSPPNIMYGLEGSLAKEMWKNFLKSLEIISEKYAGILEVRILVHTKEFADREKYIDEALAKLDGFQGRLEVRKIKLRGPPIVSPRDPGFFK